MRTLVAYHCDGRHHTQRGGAPRQNLAASNAASTREVCGTRWSSKIETSSRLRSPADCQRSSGSFAQQIFKARFRASGTVFSGGGSSQRKIAVSTSGWLPPRNALWPPIISYRTLPNAKMSAPGVGFPALYLLRSHVLRRA